MAPNHQVNTGGRPKLDWTSSRKRKLGRLYLLTDIAIPDIQRILQDEKFNPSVRSIQAQLSLLLPNNVKEWRQHRPSEKDQMVNRLAQLKRGRQNRVTKWSSSRTTSIPVPVSTSKPDNEKHHLVVQSPSPHYDPSRYYGEENTAGSPQQFTLSSFKALEMNLSPDANISRNIVSHSPDTRVVLDVMGPSGIQALGRRGQFKDMAHSLTRRTSETMRRVPASIHSKISHCLSHIESVISTTNSWRSSLLDAMSFSTASEGGSTRGCDMSLTREEYRTWDELIDESHFSKSANSSTDEDAISLRTRPCCEFFENDVEKRVLCKVCGFSEAHSLARSSMSDDPGLIDVAVVDRFANTPLHHAAAAANLGRVVQLMKLVSSIHARNTSGQTFLHVLERGDNSQSEFDEVLRIADSLLFDFSAKDYMGNMVSQRYEELDYLNGDTELIARLRRLPIECLSYKELVKLISRSNVNQRAKRGYSAIAIAVRHGNRDALTLLLEHGANPNNRGYRKTSIMAFAAMCLAKAQKDQDDSLYARVLSCIVLLANSGGKADPTVYDEFTIRAPTPRGKKPLVKVVEASNRPFVPSESS
ncbi:hypothetical protein BJ878DRAFT_428047 [Calycina marina]|uniref:Ankyrin n=1 Tax=Calycina marina TaxID=1763456 RepID=A0A9P7YX72_9HELO|nr:hypothetical protein BJ878DRAFT_428047 [Calycina marina]